MGDAGGGEGVAGAPAIAALVRSEPATEIGSRFVAVASTARNSHSPNAGNTATLPKSR